MKIFVLVCAVLMASTGYTYGGSDNYGSGRISAASVDTTTTASTSDNATTALTVYDPMATSPADYSVAPVGGTLLVIPESGQGNWGNR
jgi:hypothetical protein